MKRHISKMACSVCLLGLLAFQLNATDGFGFPQRYTGVATEFEYATETECLTVIEHQYQVTDCPIAPWLCWESQELIATHETTICP